MPSYYTFLQLRPSATEAICAIVLALFLASVFPPAGFRISHGPSCPPTRLPNVNPKHFALLRAPCHMPLFHDKPRKLVTNCPPLAPPFGLASVFLDAYIHVHAYGEPAMPSYHPKYHRQCLNDTYEYDYIWTESIYDPPYAKNILIVLCNGVYRPSPTQTLKHGALNHYPLFFKPHTQATPLPAEPLQLSAQSSRQDAQRAGQPASPAPNLCSRSAHHFRPGLPDPDSPGPHRHTRSAHNSQPPHTPTPPTPQPTSAHTLTQPHSSTNPPPLRTPISRSSKLVRYRTTCVRPLSPFLLRLLSLFQIMATNNPAAGQAAAGQAAAAAPLNPNLAQQAQAPGGGQGDPQAAARQLLRDAGLDPDVIHVRTFASMANTLQQKEVKRLSSTKPRDFLNWRNAFWETAQKRQWSADRARQELRQCFDGDAFDRVQGVDLRSLNQYADDDTKQCLDRIQKRFLPEQGSPASYRAFREARQNAGELILDWHSRLRTLYILASPQALDPFGLDSNLELIDRFVNGIADTAIARHVMDLDPRSYETALQQALNKQRTELNMSDRDKSSAPPPSLNAMQPPKRRQNQTPAINPSQRDRVCWHCGIPGHMRNDCRKFATEITYWARLFNVNPSAANTAHTGDTMNPNPPPRGNPRNRGRGRGRGGFNPNSNRAINAVNNDNPAPADTPVSDALQAQIDQLFSQGN